MYKFASGKTGTSLRQESADFCIKGFLGFVTIWPQLGVLSSSTVARKQPEEMGKERDECGRSLLAQL